MENEEKKTKHSPTPWWVDGTDWKIRDAKDKTVVLSVAHERDEEVGNLDLIVEAVNAYDKLRAENATLNEVAVNLQRSREKVIEDNDRLRELVRRLIDKLDDAWDFIDRIDTNADDVCYNLHEAMNEARKALGEEAGNADE